MSAIGVAPPRHQAGVVRPRIRFCLKVKSKRSITRQIVLKLADGGNASRNSARVGSGRATIRAPTVRLDPIRAREIWSAPAGRLAGLPATLHQACTQARLTGYFAASVIGFHAHIPIRQHTCAQIERVPTAMEILRGAEIYTSAL